MTRRRITQTRGRSRITETRGRWRLSSACALAAALVALPGRAAPEPHPVDARVVWARADRVYIAAADSLALAPGDRLTLMRGKKSVASGAVLQVLARDLAAARLTSGSLDRESRLDRVRILAERPPLRALPLLRIGGPGRGRPGLLFGCDRPAPHPPAGAGGYRTDSLAENAYRMVRVEAAPGGAPWPDTMLVRLFGDVADEEIALERGELDLAVFWPGEASSRLRSDPRGWDLIRGARSRGVLATVAPAGGVRAPSADHPALAALNEQMFRGDLAPWRGRPDSLASPPGGVRFEVDPSCAGRLALQRFLDRAAPAPAAADPPARLLYYDAPAGTLPPEARPLFTVRCAIAVEPGLRPYVAALGPGALADLIDCAPPGRAP